MISSPSSAQIEVVMLNCRDSFDLNGQRLHMVGKDVIDIMTARVNYLLAQQTAPKLTTIFVSVHEISQAEIFIACCYEHCSVLVRLSQLFSLSFLKGAVVITIGNIVITIGVSGISSYFGGLSSVVNLGLNCSQLYRTQLKRRNLMAGSFHVQGIPKWTFPLPSYILQKPT